MSIYFYVKKHICSFCELVAVASIFACLDTQHFLESWLGAETSPLVTQALGCRIIVVIQGAWNTSQNLSRLTLFVTSWEWMLTCIAMGLAIVLDGLVWTEPFFLVFLTSRRGTKACALWFGRLCGSLHNRWSPTWFRGEKNVNRVLFLFFPFPFYLPDGHEKQYPTELTRLAKSSLLQWDHLLMVVQ